ncbi:hypothetical protein QCE81_33080, partial [Caballeronia sp. LZ002]|nr:hypothetical protein [Caballeronia sp. LZ002]
GLAEADQVKLRSVYLDGVPVENNDGSRNFQVEQFETRKGGIQQDAIDWVTAASSEVQVGHELQRRLVDKEESGGKIKVTHFTPCSIEVSEPDVSEVDVTVQVSNLWWDSNKGHTNATVELQFEPSYRTLSKDELPPKTESWEITGLKDKPPPKTESWKITGVCQVYCKTFTFPVHLAAGARFVLKISRTDVIDQGENAGKKHGTAHVLSYTKRRTGKFKYPGSALVAMQISSQKFDRVPVRSYDVKGLLVEVPDNYDQAGREYKGTWTGKFKRAWTDNPAWIFRDLLLNRRYG